MTNPSFLLQALAPTKAAPCQHSIGTKIAQELQDKTSHLHQMSTRLKVTKVCTTKQDSRLSSFILLHVHNVQKGFILANIY